MIADSPRDVPDVPVEVLRAALELVVEVLRHDQRQPGAAPVSLAIRQALQARRLTKNHLIAMRKVVVSDPELRARVATVADIDLVGAAGLAWLHRGPGWEDSVRAAAEVQTAAERDEARTAYNRYNTGQLEDYDFPEEAIATIQQRLPKVEL